MIMSRPNIALHKKKLMLWKILKTSTLSVIQELLGHNSSRTTEIYTHVSKKKIENIKSPFDDL